jgi:hypothetical protein
MTGYPTAPGRADHQTHLLVQDIVGTILDELEARLLGIVVNGRVPATAISGQLGASQGGTGNAIGQTTPLDGSVTDAKVAVGADIDPAKLDQVLLKTVLYNFAKVMLLGSTDVTVSPADGPQTLTWSIVAPDRTLDSLSDVIITAAAAGDMLLAFLEGGSIVWRNVHGLPSPDDGALYVGGDYMTIGGDTLTVGS